MRVLILNSLRSGGAAKAASRLGEAISTADGKVRVDFVSLEDLPLPRRLIGALFEKIEYRAIQNMRGPTGNRFSLPFLGVVRANWLIKKHQPDIVHVHWINAGFLSWRQLGKLVQQVPVLWSMHDIWPITGGCHYNAGCLRYEHNCGNCPQIKASRQKDFTAFSHSLKAKSQVSQSISLVGLSRWLYESACASSLTFRDYHNLPNTIDTTRFKPLPAITGKKGCSVLILSPDLRDKRKGFHLFSEAEKKCNSDFRIVVVGRGGKYESKRRTELVGFVDSEDRIIQVYNECSVLAFPSMEENLSNVIMESLACGTPVVAFDVGGNCDLIKHKVNGYLAKPFDTQDFADGMTWLLEHREETARNAVALVQQKFDYQVVAKRYLELYRAIRKEDGDI